jgi:lipopolysaccharide heptosyltransferase II
MKASDKILIVMPDKHLGNFVIALNAIKPLREYYGVEKIAIVFDETHRDMVAANLGLENIIFYPRKQLETQSSFLQRAQIYWKFMQQVRRFKPTISAALEACNVSALISYLSGAKRRIGLDVNKFPLLFNEKISFRKNGHRLESYFDIMAVLGLPPTSQLISLETSQQDIDTVNRILAEKGISSDKPLICIHTGAGKPHKQWPIENFAELAKALADTENYEIALTGGPAEQAQNKIVLSRCSENVYDLACCLSVSQLIALFKKTTLLISNDSGPMHIAALSGTPVLALFGPTDQVIWGPLSEKATVLLGNATCTNNCHDKYREPVTRCFCSLTIENALSTARNMLNG